MNKAQTHTHTHREREKHVWLAECIRSPCTQPKNIRLGEGHIFFAIALRASHTTHAYSSLPTIKQAATKEQKWIKRVMHSAGTVVLFSINTNLPIVNTNNWENCLPKIVWKTFSSDVSIYSLCVRSWIFRFTTATVGSLHKMRWTIPMKKMKHK